MRVPLGRRRIALIGGSCLTLVLYGWLFHDLGQSHRPRADQDLLAVLQNAPLRLGPPMRSPRPPAAPAWHSPLASQVCVPPAPALVHRLALTLRRLPATVQSIPTDPSNFAERQNQDAYGNPVDPRPRVVVLHETVYGLQSAINTFITPHSQDDDQVSYHTLIGLNGAVVQVLDPSLRAFGAGHSAFQGQWVITNPRVGGSINNFALHLSLETPIDGENEGPGHSGYSQAQYDAAAVVIAGWMQRYGIPWQHITTHRQVDLGGERADPRSFDWKQLQTRLVALGVMGCGPKRA